MKVERSRTLSAEKVFWIVKARPVVSDRHNGVSLRELHELLRLLLRRLRADLGRKRSLEG